MTLLTLGPPGDFVIALDKIEIDLILLQLVTPCERRLSLKQIKRNKCTPNVYGINFRPRSIICPFVVAARQGERCAARPALKINPT